MMCPFNPFMDVPRHFHVVFGVASSLLNLPDIKMWVCVIRDLHEPCFMNRDVFCSYAANLLPRATSDHFHEQMLHSLYAMQGCEYSLQL